MSKRYDVVAGVLAMIEGACPGATVLGLDENAALPAEIPAGDLIIVRNSDPGEPEIDLSPRTYNYDHPIKVELAAIGSGGETNHQRLDRRRAQIGAAVEADRFLGGLCQYLDVDAPEVDDIKLGGLLVAGAELVITASYASLNPLT
jgi:hypothetical protein